MCLHSIVFFFLIYLNDSRSAPSTAVRWQMSSPWGEALGLYFTPGKLAVESVEFSCQIAIVSREKKTSPSKAQLGQ